MASRVTIPRAFSWLLPGQGFVAAVIIYASIYVFTVGTIPFILAVVAAGLHFILGLYICFAGNRPGSFHLFVVPIWLICCAGVWAGTLYYFSATLDLIIKIPFGGTPGQPLYTTWVKVGTATAALNVVLDFVMLGVFIHGAITQTSQQTPPISAPVYAAPPMAPQDHSFAQAQQYPQLQQQQQQYQLYQTHQQYPSFIQYQPQQPTYQYQQQQQQQRQQSPIHPLSHHPSHDEYKTPTPPSTVSPTTGSPANAVSYPYDVRNRIDVIRRLCSLQHPDGHWDYSDELAELVRLWGGRELMAPAHGVTALTHACLMDLCNYVWTAQREGREQESLSAAELISLQAVSWDLTWAKKAMDRATGWMSGYR